MDKKISVAMISSFNVAYLLFYGQDFTIGTEGKFNFKTNFKNFFKVLVGMVKFMKFTKSFKGGKIK